VISCARTCARSMIIRLAFRNSPKARWVSFSFRPSKAPENCRFLPPNRGSGWELPSFQHRQMRQLLPNFGEQLCLKIEEQLLPNAIREDRTNPP
jgi:hypothetical protein